jgi:predicted alpha/beta hydrolase family esterase
MKRAVILHGTQNSPEGNWFRWLETELTGDGLEVWLPQLPGAEHPSLAEWADFVHKECPFELNEESIIIGHSSGGVLGLILAQANSGPLGAVVSVSAFKDNDFLKWDACDRLFDVPFDFAAMRLGADQIVMVQSDTDPYVPMEQAEYLAKNSGAELIVIPGQGHFNLEQGDHYKQFPKLIEILQERRLLK